MISQIRRIYTNIFFRSRFFFSAVVLSLTANALIWILIVLGFSTLYQADREFIPLHYKVPIGPDFYSNWYWIFVLPITGLLFIIFNFFFGRFVYPRQRVLALSLSTLGLITQIIFIRAVYLIIQINLY
ncbi:hypothetical protein HY621_03310 [Candidatus Uhrbacteria bacterium]|nr:hypothetical protein [Candidatus Uhrbacteria bacterium]